MKGYNVATLPKNIETIYNIIYIRILRFIGGICLLLILTGYSCLLPTYLHIPIIVIGTIQSVQIIIIFLIKFIYGIYTLKYKSDKF